MKKNTKTTKTNQTTNIIVAIAFTIVIFALSLGNVLYSLDSFCTDHLYNREYGTSPNIVIIGVDEETLAEYGNFTNWSREKTADVIDILCADKNNAPAVIGVDFMFVDEFAEDVDSRLISVVETVGCGTAGFQTPVVMATNIVYRGALKENAKQGLYYDVNNIDRIEVPFEALSKVSENGFTNALIADDGYVRYGAYQTDYNGENVYSFAYQIYRLYAEKTNIGAIVPKTNKDNQFQFFYSGKTGEYSHVSMCDVLNGTVPNTAFKDSIVLIGAYAPGFQDAYQVGIDRGDPMYGVEIHANMIQAFMEEKTATNASRLLMAIIAAVLIGVIVVLGDKLKLSFALVLSIFSATVYTVIGCVLAGWRTVIPIVYALLGIIAADVYFVINKYLLEKIRRKRTLSVFKQYVAPQVVDELAASGDFEIRLGGEKRDIAVLFVDIRGFTPLSEGLEPEQVVNILNEYLSHTTACIFKHGGTLDKFIGDATMAVFNAPFSQEDYVYEAVATAWDIANGADELGARLEKEYGRKVSFGVGVNCGEAVVGNIGCETRMDYTAIGDTVNTAARLESNASAGQVLISQAVYDRLQGRIAASSIGEIPLKGKSIKLEVYEVTDINEG